jgi:hypothetical protein
MRNYLKKNKKIQNLFFAIAATLSAMVIIMMLYEYLYTGYVFGNSKTPTPIFTSTQQTSQNDLTVRLNQLESDVTQMRQELDTLSQVPSSNLDIVFLQDKLTSIDNRLTKIENVILDNPEKALELTLLQKDFEDLKTSYQSDISQTRRDIDRVYAQSNWFIGLMFTMALALISLTVGNLLKGREKSTTEKDK